LYSSEIIGHEDDDRAEDNIRVIYGDDNRVDVFESTNNRYIELSRSVAAKILNMSLPSEDGVVNILGSNLVDRFNVCSDERFVQQRIAASCTGFLVAPNILITAGHCMRHDFDCQQFSWVFDFKVQHSDQENVQVNESQVYGCSEILKHDFDPINEYFENDYAVVLLDRSVDDREPLQVRLHGKIDDHQKLVIIGHPSGLPLKIAAQAQVRNNNHYLYFMATLDAFGGNSGSPVFNADTEVVEGVLVLGEDDYIDSPDKNCKVPKRCALDECHGEQVIRTTSIPFLKTLNVKDN